MQQPYLTIRRKDTCDLPSYYFISMLILKVQSRFKQCIYLFIYPWWKEYVALCHFTAFSLLLFYFFNSDPYLYIVSDLRFTAHVRNNLVMM